MGSKAVNTKSDKLHGTAAKVPASRAIVKHAPPADEARWLAKLGSATKMLAEVRDAPSAKHAMDVAAAAELYARKQKLGEEAERYAMGVKLDAEAMLGHYLDGNTARAGRPEIGSDGEPISDRGAPTIAELGISKHLSTEAKKLSDLRVRDPELFDRVKRCEVSLAEALDPAYGGKRKRASGSVSGADAYDSDEWYTPVDYIEAAREVLGSIDLDPATCEHAQSRIKATRFFTKDDDGLAQEWHGCVWLNPPYSQPAATQFAEKLIAEHRAGRVTAGIVIQNASTDTAWFHALAREGSICLTRGRINFDREDGRGSQNRYGQAFFYVGANHAAFERVFARFGLVGRLHGAD